MKFEITEKEARLVLQALSDTSHFLRYANNHYYDYPASIYGVRELLDLVLENLIILPFETEVTEK